MNFCSWGRRHSLSPLQQVRVLNLHGSDMHTPHVRNHETFIKTEINDRGDEHGGIAFERDPVRHRIVAKQTLPAFSPREIIAQEPEMHKYIDLFTFKMKSLSDLPDGIDRATWCNWSAMDISANITYNHEMNQMRDSRSNFTKSHPFSRIRIEL